MNTNTNSYHYRYHPCASYEHIPTPAAYTYTQPMSAPALNNDAAAATLVVNFARQLKENAAQEDAAIVGNTPVGPARPVMANATHQQQNTSYGSIDSYNYNYPVSDQNNQHQHYNNSIANNVQHDTKIEGGAEPGATQTHQENNDDDGSEDIDTTLFPKGFCENDSLVMEYARRIFENDEDITKAPSLLRTIEILRHLSCDHTLHLHSPALRMVVTSYSSDKKTKHLLLSIYESALNITSVMPMLGDWKKGSREGKTKLNGYNVYGMRKSVEDAISYKLHERFQFISILHFTLFMLATKGYVRQHEKSWANHSGTKMPPHHVRWRDLSRSIKRGYSTVAPFLRDGLS